MKKGWRCLAWLASAVVVFLLATGSTAQARLYRYVDTEGEEHFTNSPQAVPERYRNQLEAVEFKQPLPTEEDAASAPTKGALAPPAAIPEAGDASPMLGRMGRVGGALVSGASLPLELARKFVIDPVSGLVSLPESLEQAEARARPYLRMALVFLVALAAGVFLFSVLRHVQNADPSSWANSPLIKFLVDFRGMVFIAAAGLGGLLVYVVWYGAQLDWRQEMRLLWQSTAGQFLAPGEEPALRVSLSSGSVTVDDPQKLMDQHEALAAAYFKAIALADGDIGSLERVCTGQQAPERPQALVKQLLSMDSSLKKAELEEADLVRFREAAERRGFSLGTDPRVTAQAKMAELHERLKKAQGACRDLAQRGRQEKTRILEGAEER